MAIDKIEQELGMMQLSDSFFPTGNYTMSNGLESLVIEKKIQNVNELTNLLKIQIIQQIGPSDCVALTNVFDCIHKQEFDKLIELDNIFFATKMIKEIRDASVRSGIQLTKCVSEFVKDDPILNQYQKSIIQNNAHGVYPVAFGICCNALKIDKEKSATMMLYGFTVSIVGAALRLGLIHHFDGQKIIHDIKPIIRRTIKDCLEKSILDMWQFVPQLEVVQMSHEKMDSKMFIT